MHPNTKLSSKKYKTVGQLLQAPIRSIISVANNEKNVSIRAYLYRWLYINYYGKKEMAGNLTNRVRNIANNASYYYITKNIFDNVDILQHMKTKKILNNKCIEFIKKIHTIDPILNGIFLDYLMRRIISEKMNIPFYDHRAEYVYNISMLIDNKDYTSKLLIRIHDEYKIVENTSKYKTKNILNKIFIVSLSQVYLFGGTFYKKRINDITKLLNNSSDTLLLYVSLDKLCSSLLNKKSNVLLNPTLGHMIPKINKTIPSDCDIVINDKLYDIKSTNSNKHIYEILQLLGYASLLECIPEFNRKINKINTINLLQGRVVSYDITHITKKQKLNYLKLLTKKM